MSPINYTDDNGKAGQLTLDEKQFREVCEGVGGWGGGSGCCKYQAYLFV